MAGGGDGISIGITPALPSSLSLQLPAPDRVLTGHLSARLSVFRGWTPGQHPPLFRRSESCYVTILHWTGTWLVTLDSISISIVSSISHLSCDTWYSVMTVMTVMTVNECVMQWCLRLLVTAMTSVASLPTSTICGEAVRGCTWVARSRAGRCWGRSSWSGTSRATSGVTPVLSPAHPGESGPGVWCQLAPGMCCHLDIHCNCLDGFNDPTFLWLLQ